MVAVWWFHCCSWDADESRKELSQSGTLCLPSSLSGELVPALLFFLMEGEEREKVKLAAAGFLFQDKGEGLLAQVYLVVIDLIV